MNLLIYLYTHMDLFFFFNDPATTQIYTLSLHDALPISHREHEVGRVVEEAPEGGDPVLRLQVEVPEDEGRDRHLPRSEEHTSELQSRLHLVCRLLLEKKKKKTTHNINSHTTMTTSYIQP